MGKYMTRLKELAQTDPATYIALLHGNPDERPSVLVDALTINGIDPFAARRQLIREHTERMRAAERRGA